MQEDSKLLNFIRRVLIKVVVPFQKKYNNVKSKIRLSIKLKIATIYASIMFIFGIIIILIFFLLFLKITETSIDKSMDSIVANVEENNEIMDKNEIDDRIYYQRINPRYLTDIVMRIYDDRDNIIYDDSFGRFYVDRCNILKNAYFEVKGQDKSLYFKEEKSINIRGVQCKIVYQIDFSTEINVFIKLAGIMIVVIVILTIIMSTGGMRRMNPIFRTIDQMAYTVNKMSVNNLSSDRLNIYGTKDELKDLAITINDMLDRLDTSYESQKQFVSDASHELRTPIAVIQGYINMVDRWGKNDEAIMEEAITAIKEESQSMKDLVEKLLFLSRHDKKTLKLDKKIINLRPIVEDLIREMKIVNDNKVFQSYYLENALIYGDKQSIKQALRVLIDNAIKYSPDGAIICVSCKTNDFGQSVLEVRDSGYGMKKEELEKIFDRFYRADTIRNKKISGNGLGLSLAKLIFLKHTGKIVVTSQYGKGSSFEITFPKIM